MPISGPLFARSADQRPRLRRARERMRSAVLAPVYALYARRLRTQVRARQLPAHVAVILDGNRRWATSLGFADSSVGHLHGADKLDELIGWCRSLGIPEVTVWALSGENFERPAAELEALLEVIVAKLDQLASPSGRGQTKIRVATYRQPATSLSLYGGTATRASAASFLGFADVEANANTASPSPRKAAHSVCAQRRWSCASA